MELNANATIFYCMTIHLQSIVSKKKQWIQESDGMEIMPSFISPLTKSCPDHVNLFNPVN